jgi:hypothetical protein
MTQTYITEDLRALEVAERLGAPYVPIMGHLFERLAGDRWRRIDGRLVLILDLQDGAEGLRPWRLEIDLQLMETRFLTPWRAIAAGCRMIERKAVST